MCVKSVDYQDIAVHRVSVDDIDVQVVVLDEMVVLAYRVWACRPWTYRVSLHMMLACSEWMWAVLIQGTEGTAGMCLCPAKNATLSLKYFSLGLGGPLQAQPISPNQIWWEHTLSHGSVC